MPIINNAERDQKRLVEGMNAKAQRTAVAGTLTPLVGLPNGGGK